MKRKKSSKKNTPKRPHFQQRREEIKELLIKLGEHNLHKTALANKYQCDRKQIYNDIIAIKKLIKKDDLESINNDLYFGLRQVESKLRRIIVGDSDNKDIIAASNVYTKVSDSIPKHMETFGDKEKIADKQQVDNKVEVFLCDPRLKDEK